VVGVGSVVGTVGGCVTGGEVVGGGVVGGAVGRGIVVTVGRRVVVGATVTVGLGGGAVVTVGGTGTVVVTVGGAGVGPGELRGGGLAVSATASVVGGTSSVDATSSTLSVGGAEPTSVVSAAPASSSATESLVPESSVKPLADVSASDSWRASACSSACTDTAGGRVRTRSGLLDPPCHGPTNSTTAPTQMMMVAARNGAFQIQECSRRESRSSWRFNQRDILPLPSAMISDRVRSSKPIQPA
jgi:hypothetical protein